MVLALNLKTSGYGTGIIAREMALDIAHSEYKPSVAEHVPGVDNVLADMLSRKFAPGFTYVLPPCFRPEDELVVCQRDRTYYRTLLKKSPVVPEIRQTGI